MAADAALPFLGKLPLDPRIGIVKYVPAWMKNCLPQVSVVTKESHFSLKSQTHRQLKHMQISLMVCAYMYTFILSSSLLPLPCSDCEEM